MTHHITCAIPVRMGNHALYIESCDYIEDYIDAMGVRGLFTYIRSERSTIKLNSIRLFKQGDEKVILVCDLMAVI